MAKEERKSCQVAAEVVVIVQDTILPSEPVETTGVHEQSENVGARHHTEQSNEEPLDGH